MVHVLPNNTAYLGGAKAAVTFASPQLFSDTKKDPVTHPNEKRPKIVPWGEQDDLPIKIIKAVEKNTQLATSMLFNVLVTSGEGVIPVVKDDKGEWVEYADNKEINDFFRDNDINYYMAEQIMDLHYFFNMFPEIILDRKGKKIVSLSHKEATFSRWSELDETTGTIDFHYYCAMFGTSETPVKKDIIDTPALDSRSPLRDLKIRLGILPDPKTGKNRSGSQITKDRRFVIPLNFPSPGRFYYQKPYWYSVIESGWIEFADKIPEFKKALMNNQATIKYHIQLHPDYFKVIFENEGLTSDKEQRDRIKKEYENFDKFLKDTKNTGKSLVSFQKKDPAANGGFDYSDMMKIETIDNNLDGGEYIADLEEVSNMINYAMMVHPSLIGSSPGKTKNINGTEARELFIIKQALLKPFRKTLLKPLYLVKWFNKWPEDVHFAIPDITLTTLDKEKTGSTTNTEKS